MSSVAIVEGLFVNQPSVVHVIHELGRLGSFECAPDALEVIRLVLSEKRVTDSIIANASCVLIVEELLEFIDGLFILSTDLGLE